MLSHFNEFFFSILYDFIVFIQRKIEKFSNIQSLSRGLFMRVRFYLNSFEKKIIKLIHKFTDGLHGIAI